MIQIEKNLPKKLYYTLKEASQILGVKPHVLRYWGKEFKIKRGRKNKRQIQKYHREDLKKILKIKGYLYNELYSVAGAKKKLGEEKKKKVEDEDIDYRRLLLKVKRGLRSIETMVK